MYPQLFIPELHTSLDGVSGLLWRLGGATGLGFLVAVIGFFKGFAIGGILAVLLVLAWQLRPRLWQWLAGGLAALAYLGACAIAIVQIATIDGSVARSRELTGPFNLLDEWKGGPLFVSRSALPFVLLRDPAAAKDLTEVATVRLANDPGAWREQLRRSDWQTVILTGPNIEFRPLLNHLLESPDWHLAAVTNQGYVFLRGAGATPHEFDPMKFQLGSDRETAVYLAALADRYEALRDTRSARDCITRALKLAGNDATVLSYAAAIEAGHKRWADSLGFADRALSADPRSSYALLLKTLALLETGRPDKAEPLARQLMERAPNDTYTLFLYARVCRELRDSHTEAETLQKLIAVSQRQGLAVPPNYYVYLGQAYVLVGDAPQAAAAYRKALEIPGLGPELTESVRDALKTVESKIRR
jgi:tetratricopeptide (TPR) repeat protein